MSHRPRSVEVSGVDLPEGLPSLTERLAENAHGVWASRRLGEGWTYGRGPDDQKRTHRHLVPCAQLSEAETEYDRDTAMSAVKAIRALGQRSVGDRQTADTNIDPQKAARPGSDRETRASAYASRVGCGSIVINRRSQW
jgi:hypothetical protein